MLLRYVRVVQLRPRATESFTPLGIHSTSRHAANHNVMTDGRWNCLTVVYAQLQLSVVKQVKKP